MKHIFHFSNYEEMGYCASHLDCYITPLTIVTDEFDGDDLNEVVFTTAKKIPATKQKAMLKHFSPKDHTFNQEETAQEEKHRYHVASYTFNERLCKYERDTVAIAPSNTIEYCVEEYKPRVEQERFTLEKLYFVEHNIVDKKSKVEQGNRANLINCILAVQMLGYHVYEYKRYECYFIIDNNGVNMGSYSMLEAIKLLCEVIEDNGYYGDSLYFISESVLSKIEGSGVKTDVTVIENHSYSEMQRIKVVMQKLGLISYEDPGNYAVIEVKGNLQYIKTILLKERLTAGYYKKVIEQEITVIAADDYNLRHITNLMTNMGYPFKQVEGGIEVHDNIEHVERVLQKNLATEKYPYMGYDTYTK